MRRFCFRSPVPLLSSFLQCCTPLHCSVPIPNRTFLSLSRGSTTAHSKITILFTGPAFTARRKRNFIRAYTSYAGFTFRTSFIWTWVTKLAIPPYIRCIPPQLSRSGTYSSSLHTLTTPSFTFPSRRLDKRISNDVTPA